MKRTISALCLMLSTTTACGGGSDAPPSDPAVVAEAKQVWETRCATCHGTAGDGNGPGAAALKPKPRSFKDTQWQMYTQNDRLKKVIVEGGKSVGLSELMVPNADLATKPAVVDELVKTIRAFR